MGFDYRQYVQKWGTKKRTKPTSLFKNSVTLQFKTKVWELFGTLACLG